jgi:hypothetical protein
MRSKWMIANYLVSIIFATVGWLYLLAWVMLLLI